MTGGRSPYLFLSPFLLLFGVFGIYPILKSLILSLYMTNGPRSFVFVGLDNFLLLFRDPEFHRAVWNTTVFAVCSVFLQLPLSLGLALLLNHPRLRGKNLFRLAFFAPNLVGQVFVGVLFTVIFAPSFGLLNRLLHACVGIPIDTKWLQRADLVMPALVLTAMWLYVGFNMIYFLAALQNVDQSLYEAAKIDGAGPFRRFLVVTLPSIRPVGVFVVLLSTIGSFQLFELPFMLLSNTSGPDNSGLTVVMYLYQNGFVTGDLGYASAVGWTLALGVMLLALVQMRLSGFGREEV